MRAQWRRQGIRARRGAEDEGPRLDDPEGIALLRSALVDAGYTPDAVREALATEVAAGRDSAELPLYLHMLEGGGALAALIKLFLLDLEVSADEAEEALPGLVDRMEAMRVLERRGDAVKALDRDRPDGGPPARLRRVPEGARPPRPRARRLAARPGARMADRARAGRARARPRHGNGHQALLAARHADHVTAVDINPRALRFAEFNAILNGGRRSTSARGTCSSRSPARRST